MNICIIIPVHNEEDSISQTLLSLLSQTYTAKQIIVVDDNSTDNSAELIKQVATEHSAVSYVYHSSEARHAPGEKIVLAFLKGLDAADPGYDVICKFDGDLIFPSDYLDTLVRLYSENPEIGMVGGVCVVENNGSWIRESVTGSNHIRGALKSYRKACYDDIGGLIPAFGWDTIDELLAEFHGWRYTIDHNLEVRHLKPTSARYHKRSGVMQGQALYGMRMGRTLTCIRALVQAFRKRKASEISQIIEGYRLAKKNASPFLIEEKEGQFIRRRQWRTIRKKILRF